MAPLGGCWNCFSNKPATMEDERRAEIEKTETRVVEPEPSEEEQEEVAAQQETVVETPTQQNDQSISSHTKYEVKEGAGDGAGDGNDDEHVGLDYDGDCGDQNASAGESTSAAREEDQEEEEEKEKVIQEGYLYKRSMYMKRWNKRYFELLETGLLRYKTKPKDKKYRGLIPLPTWQSVGLLPPLKSHPKWTGFYLHTTNDSFALASESLEQAQHWVSCLVHLFTAEDSTSRGNGAVAAPLGGAEGDDESGKALAPFTASPIEEKEQQDKERKSSSASSRGSFSFSPSIFSSRGRTASIIESPHSQAEHEEQFSLVSGMMKDILNKKDLRIQELEDELRGAREAARRESKKEVEDSQNKLREREAEVGDLKGEISTLESSTHYLQSQNEDLQARNEELEAEVKDLKQTCEKLQGQVGKAGSEANERMKLIVTDLETRTRMHSELEIKYLELKDKLSEMEGAVLRPFWSPKSPKTKSRTKK